MIAELFGFTETSVSTSQTITQFTVSPELSFTFTGCTYSNGSYIDDPSQQTCAELSIKYVTEASDGSGETIPSAEVPAVAKASFKQKATEHSADDNDDTATVVEELPAVADGSFMVTQRSMLGEVIYAFAPWSDTTVVVTLRDACTDEPLQAGTVVGVLDRFVNGAA
ncbi:MAG: hypothetical protein R2714_16410 [Microthrixaceae bacterium]